MHQGLGDAEVDFPFRVSPAEQSIIELETDISVILVGRSGTGKTTVAVYRMWGQWLASHGNEDAEPINQVLNLLTFCMYGEILLAVKSQNSNGAGPNHMHVHYCGCTCHILYFL